jgi:hypothetical protein
MIDLSHCRRLVASAAPIGWPRASGPGRLTPGRLVIAVRGYSTNQLKPEDDQGSAKEHYNLLHSVKILWYNARGNVGL